MLFFVLYSPEASPNRTSHLCLRHACREHCQSHSARDHVSGGLLSVSVDSGNGALSQTVMPVVLAGFVFGLFTVKPANMMGLYRTLEGMNALPANSVTLSRSLL